MNLSDAIHWRWPSAHCVVRGEVLDRWDGPLPRPTDSDIASALSNYQAHQIAAFAQLRAERTRRLADCDWTQMGDVLMLDAARAEWRVYRQALRDIPRTQTDLDAIVWPTPPGT